MHEPQKNVYDLHGPISPNCCTVTIFEYSTTERSRYLAVCQLRANTLLRKANGRMQI